MHYRPIRTIIEHQEIVVAPGKTRVIEAACLMQQRQVGAVMVVEDGRLVGIFTERDALFRVIAERRDARITQLAEVMTANPRTIHPDNSLGDALRMMNEGGFRHVPVVENDRPVGMVSSRDALGPELEDFVYEMVRREQIQNILT